MTIRLESADSIAQKSGVSMLLFGPAKVGKTTALTTLPTSDTIILSLDNGFASLRGCKTLAYEARTALQIDEFFKWHANSAEAKKFNITAVDDVSELCRIYLDHFLTRESVADKKKHGQESYGNMAEFVSKHMRYLKSKQSHHSILLAKELLDGPVKRPFLLGKAVSAEIPFLVNEILYLNVVNFGQPHGEMPAILTKKSASIDCGTRTPLNEYEPVNLAHIIQKILNYQS